MNLKLALLVLFAVMLVNCAGPPPKPASSTASNPSSRQGTQDGYYRVRRGDNLSTVAFKFGLDWREIARLNNIPEPYIIYPDQELRLTGNFGAAEPGLAGGGSSAGGSAGVAAGSSSVQTTAMPSPGSSTTRTVEIPRSTTTTVDSSASVEASAESQSEPPASSTEPATSAGTGPPTAAKTPATGTAAATGTQAPTSAAYATPGKDPAHWLWPTDGKVISRFQANDPARKGIDIGGVTGQSVIAAANGQVVYSGNGLLGYGELIIIKHSDRMLSAYAHNSKRMVSEGQQVTAGSQIAEMGTNDRNQPELHFEIRVNGSPQDPLKYLPQR